MIEINNKSVQIRLMLGIVVDFLMNITWLLHKPVEILLMKTPLKQWRGKCGFLGTDSKFA